MNNEYIISEIQKKLSSKRFEHSMSSMKTASDLADFYNLDKRKAQIAALLHDCAKEIPKNEILKFALKYSIPLDDITEKETVLLHGPIGAKIAEFEYGILDKEILDAIDCHTTGKKDMTELDKIVYLADYIEPSRDFSDVEKLRFLTKEDLDKAVRFALELTISELIKNGRLIHPRTIEARNSLVIKYNSEQTLELTKNT